MPKVHRGSSKRKDANQAVYHVNTLCFARVRGYQPWPARIIEKKNGNKYQVTFFGTYDNATVAPVSLYYSNFSCNLVLKSSIIFSGLHLSF